MRTFRPLPKGVFVLCWVLSFVGCSTEGEDFEEITESAEQPINDANALAETQSPEGAEEIKSYCVLTAADAKDVAKSITLKVNGIGKFKASEDIFLHEYPDGDATVIGSMFGLTDPTIEIYVDVLLQGKTLASDEKSTDASDEANLHNLLKKSKKEKNQKVKGSGPGNSNGNGIGKGHGYAYGRGKHKDKDKDNPPNTEDYIYYSSLEGSIISIGEGLAGFQITDLQLKDAPLQIGTGANKINQNYGAYADLIYSEFELPEGIPEPALKTALFTADLKPCAKD